MHIGDSPDEAAFRSVAHEWLTAHALPRSLTSSSAHLHNLEEHAATCRKWQRVLYDGGWAGLTWPKEFGGRGLTGIQAAIFGEEMAKTEINTGVFTVAIGMVGPTLIAHATPEQQARFLPAILRGDELWCQLFSEPNAGSDLASLQTKAVLDGDTFIVNGQKVWTSFGQYCDWGILLTRTSNEGAKQAGITYLLVDMRTPGIEVRPITQINGVKHFNEVFLTNVRIPKENVLGEINDGWRVANTTLTSERGAIGGGHSAWNVENLVDLARQLGVNTDPVIRQRLAAAIIRANIMKYTGYRLRTAMANRTMPGGEALSMKLAMAIHWKATTELAVDILGPAGMLSGDDSPSDGAWQHYMLNQYAIRIGGGTDEIQRNIIAERALGLPKDAK